jgi:hypothetical protein
MNTTKTISEKKLNKHLQKILDENPNTIKACVIQEAFDYHNTKGFFEELSQYGCISGMVSSLVYYSDTEAFFDNYYHEIMELKEDYEESIGEAMKLPYNLKNHLAWFSFEQTAYQLVNEIGFEI